MHVGELRLIEPVPIEDEICSGGLQVIEDIGLGARFVLAHEQTCYEDGSAVLVVKRKIVLPWHVIRPGLEMTAGFIARRAVTGAVLRLVKR